MNSPFSSLRNYLLSTAVFGLTGLGVGCVITTGGGNCDECGGVLCHSQENSAGECVCDPGYEWEDPGDNANYECNQIQPKNDTGQCTEPNSYVSGNQCFCDSGYNWCSDAADDFTCCDDPDQAMTGGPTGGNDDVADDGVMTSTAGDTADGSADGLDSTGGGPVCEQTPATPSTNEPLAADCTEDGLEACSNVEADGPAGSRYWQCAAGEWVEMPNFPGEVCVSEGFEFSYGCVDDGELVNFECGVGPGTDCSGPECGGCLDTDIIQDCSSNKLSEDSCLRICTEEGNGKVTFDYGECVVTDVGVECACCDAGDKGCNAP